MMNAIQRRYAAALAAKDAHNAEARRIESAVLSELRITDENGNPITNSIRITDETTFDTVCELQEAALLASGYYARQPAILDEYNAAAEALVEWGLDLFGKVYPKEAQLLREEAKRSYTTRMKLVDYAFRLNASTVK